MVRSTNAQTDRYLQDLRVRLKSHFNANAGGRDRFKRRASYYHGRIEALIRQHVPEGQYVVEIGSGTGDLLAALKPRNGLGIDFAEDMVKTARSKHGAIRFEVDDIEDLKTSETFDYVVMSDVIGSLADVWTAFRNIPSLCRGDTLVFITHYNYLWAPLLRMAERLGLTTPQPLQHWLPLSDIDNLLRLNGFKVTQSGYAVLLPVNIPLVSFVLNRFIARLPLIRRLCLVQYVLARVEPAEEAAAPRSVSVMVPCRDEAGNMQSLVDRLPLLGSHTEVVFVDGESRDGTVERIEEAIKNPRSGFSYKVIRQGGAFGKADAVRKGFDACTGDIWMILDADLSVAPEDMPKFYLALAESRGQLINGSRLNYPMEDQAMRYLNNIANHLFGIAFSWLLDRHIRDTLCGTKALTKRSYERIKEQRTYFGDFDPFGDFDLLFGAAHLGLDIVEMPVRYRNRSYGETKISRFRHGLLLARMCWVALWKLKFA
ncbi:MAG: glycosyltransferase [Elusimicrobia bacterium]|nr:glycosyltransferase [Elusimicrobiota bacterium]